MEQNGAKITARQRRLIEALLTGKTISQACQVAGVGRRTYYRWVKQPHFTEALQQAEADLLTASMRRLLSMQGAAVDALQDLLTNPRLLPAERLRVVQAVLDNALRLRNATTVEQRLVELERRVAEAAGQSEAQNQE
ncbi:MAG: helix-turn-helix domain-containing protein [Anaerolinea sp.]|nr:helix-turn-helix domain-containing protein [Anaerolinea sp.]